MVCRSCLMMHSLAAKVSGVLRWKKKSKQAYALHCRRQGQLVWHSKSHPLASVCETELWWSLCKKGIGRGGHSWCPIQKINKLLQVSCACPTLASNKIRAIHLHSLHKHIFLLHQVVYQQQKSSFHHAARVFCLISVLRSAKSPAGVP